MIFATYSTFQQMHGRKSSLQELVDRLRPCSRDSVVSLCSFICVLLKLWDADPFDLSRYDHLISCAFDWLRGDWYKLAARFLQPEFVFHRRQLLLITKLAALHCQETGLDAWKFPPGYFGTILLMANDHFHYDLPIGAAAKELDKVERLFAELIPVAEGTGSRAEYKLVRSRLMLKHASQLRDHSQFIDIGSEFQRAKGISVDDYEALCFGLFARCATVSLEDLRRGASAFTFSEKSFQTTAVVKESVSLFLEDIAAAPSVLSARIRAKDHGANDFTELRRRPLISTAGGYLPVDVLFAIEKFESGPYWAINDISDKMGDRLRNFWGAVFEAYMNELFRDCLSQSGAVFVPDPRRIDDPGCQICDALILQEDSLVLLEYKASMFRAETKYSGNFKGLVEEIERKLVRDKAGSKKKKRGVEQLADAVAQLFIDRNEEVVAGLDLGAVTRVYPLLVTLDAIGGCLLISRLLNRYFSGFIDGRQFAGAQVMPMLCTDVQSIEEISGCFPTMGLARFIDHWLSKDPNFMATLTAFTVPELVGHQNERVAREWQKLSNEISARLFPEDHAKSQSAQSSL
jgi:hypothetical protein